jgi:flagellar hook-associated protein 3 FlgL
MTKKQLSGVEDADMYDATSEFKRTETALQSTLQASTKLLQPSLLNFMQ